MATTSITQESDDAQAAFPVAILNMHSAISNGCFDRVLLEQYLIECNEYYFKSINKKPDMHRPTVFFWTMHGILKEKPQDYLFKHNQTPKPIPAVVRVSTVFSIIADRDSTLLKDGDIEYSTTGVTIPEIEESEIATQLQAKSPQLWSLLEMGKPIGNSLGYGWVAPTQSVIEQCDENGLTFPSNADFLRSLLGLSHLHKGDKLVLIEFPRGCMTSVETSTPTFIEAGRNRHFLQRIEPPCKNNWGRTVNLDKLSENPDAGFLGTEEAVVGAIPLSDDVNFHDLEELGSASPSYDEESFWQYLSPKTSLSDALDQLGKIVGNPTNFISDVYSHL